MKKSNFLTKKNFEKIEKKVIKEIKRNSFSSTDYIENEVVVDKFLSKMVFSVVSGGYGDLFFTLFKKLEKYFIKNNLVVIKF